MATGKIIGFLNSDDFFSDTNILNTVAENFEDNEALYGDVHYVEKDRLNIPVRYFSGKNFKPWKMRFGLMPPHPSFYCHTQILRDNQFDIDFKICADFDLILRLIYNQKIKTKYISLDFVTMRAGGASSSGLRSHKRIFKERLKIYKKNQVPGNMLTEFCKYIIKIHEIISFKIKYHFNKNSI